LQSAPLAHVTVGEAPVWRRTRQIAFSWQRAAQSVEPAQSMVQVAPLPHWA
jgi:hypothetical protein